MLPFLAKNKDKMITTLLDSRGDKSSNPERTEITPDVEPAETSQELDSAASSLMNAIERKSIPDLKSALKACFDCLDND